MSAVQKNNGASSTAKKSESSAASKQEDGAQPKKAKGKVSGKGAANFAGGLAVATLGTPPQPPKPIKQGKKPVKKKSGGGESSALGVAPASPAGASVGSAAPATSDKGPGAGKGANSEASKAHKAVTSQAPSKLLKAYKGLGQSVTAAKRADETRAQDAIPTFHAAMPGDAQVEGKKKDKTPKVKGKVDDQVGGTEAKAPKIAKQKKGKATRQKVDGKTKSELKKAEELVDSLKSIFGSVVKGISTDAAVNTDPGPAPEIVFSGKSNPQRADKADVESDSAMNAGHEKFAQAIDEGKQPSDVHRIEMDELIEAKAVEAPKIGEAALQSGEQYYEKLVGQHTGKEIDNADAILHEDVQTQMAKSNDAMDEVLLQQEQDRDKALAVAEKDIESKNQKAKADQEKIVADSKKKIGAEQKKTRKAQDKEITQAKRKGDKERRKVEKDIDKREKSDEKKIVKEYDKTEKKAEAEKTKAEKKAAKKKKEAEKKKSEQSWWDSVKSAVSDFVDSVCSVIGDIFDALGSVVSGILNAVKDLACSVIDAAIEWAKKALDGLGSMLKGLVDDLLGDIFPELAKALNEAIDGAVDYAKQGVEAAGEALKAGVTAAVDTVNATVQKGLQVAKVGMQTAVRVAGCVATGDFEGAFLATFYGALEIAGVSRADADKMLGDAKETLKSIVDNPGGFAGNLIKAGKDGFVNFGANFLGHFTTEVTGWLLGPVAAAGLKAPESWDAQGIFGMVLGVLGVSGDSLKEMAAERIGDKNMAALDKAYEYVLSFVDGGFSGLWDQLSGDLSNIWDLVLGMVTDYITQKVVQFGMEQLASLLAGPLGALWQALKTAWGIYCTVRDKIDQIKEVLSAIFSSVSDIAAGNTSAASQWVEGALAKVLGIAIDLGANLAGIGDIPDKIRGFIEGLQERVQTAIGKAMDWVLEKVKGLFAGGADEKKDGKEADAEDPTDTPARTLPADQPIAWQGGLINLRWTQEGSILLMAEGKYPGVSSKAIDAMVADVSATPDTKERKTALAQLKSAKGLVASAHSRAGKWIRDGEGSQAELAKQTGDIGALILDGLAPLDRLKEANGQTGPDQTKTHEIGKVIPFEAAGHAHRVFIDVQGSDAQVMVASVPLPADTHLAQFKTKINASTFTGDKAGCEALISQGKKLAGIADNEADAALGGSGAVTAMIDEEKSLGDVMKKLFEATASTAEKEVHEQIVKKLDTPDRDQLATFIIQRPDGISSEQVAKLSSKQLVETGRVHWRGAFPDVTSFLLDWSKAIGDTVGTRKVGEFGKEHQKEAKGRIPAFLEAVYVVLKTNGVNGKNAMYDALKKADGYANTGLGDIVKMTKTVYRGFGADKFYKSVTLATKQGILDDLIDDGALPATATFDKDATDGPVFAEWSNRNHNERKIPSSEYDASAGCSYAKTGWWSPDGRYLDVLDKGISGSEAFKKVCEVGALAPEWYPAGLVQLHLDPGSTEFRRPTAFDGLMSPLWVQQSEHEVAATGGGAMEVLSQPVIKLGDCSAIYAHVTSQDLQAALKKFNADAKAANEQLTQDGKGREVQDPTNKYVENPSGLPVGTTPGEQAATDAQKTMADRTLEERDRAAGKTGVASNLLEHLQKNENTAHDVEPSLAAALAKEAAPAGGTRMPKTLSSVFKARPTLKSLIHASSAEGKTLKASLETISVTANKEGVMYNRDFSGGYYPKVRAAMERELLTTVRDPTIMHDVLGGKAPKLSTDAKKKIETWLLKQDGASVAADPVEEKKRVEFEKKLGKKAEKHDRAVVTAEKMAVKAGDYIALKASLEVPLADVDKKMTELMVACGSTIEQGWSGRFGNKTVAAIESIKGVFKGKGNIRELCNHVNNFCEKILGSDLLNKSTAEVEHLIKQADLGKTAVLKRRAEVDKDLKVRRDAQGRNVGAQVSGDEINASNKGDSIIENKGDTRNKTNPSKSKVIGNEGWSKTKKSEAGDQLELSDSEKEMKQYYVNANGDVVMTVDDLLPWWEGAAAWDINEESAWVQQARDLNLPLVGGVSGTTNRMMQNHALLKPGTPKADMRLTALGYLIPIKAHSFHEIMVSARANGLPYTDGHYSPLDPLTGAELTALGPLPDAPGPLV